MGLQESFLPRTLPDAPSRPRPMNTLDQEAPPPNTLGRVGATALLAKPAVVEPRRRPWVRSGAKSRTSTTSVVVLAADSQVLQAGDDGRAYAPRSSPSIVAPAAGRAARWTGSCLSLAAASRSGQPPSPDAARLLRRAGLTTEGRPHNTRPTITKRRQARRQLRDVGPTSSPGNSPTRAFATDRHFHFGCGWRAGYWLSAPAARS